MASLSLTIREAVDEAEWQSAMELARRTFMENDAPIYSDEGIRNFEDFIRCPLLKDLHGGGAYDVYTAWDGDALVGMAALRQACHLSLLFVDPKRQREGIGGMILYYLCRQIRTFTENESMTVNAAPTAYEFYRSHGFCATGLEVTENGIRYTPMERVLI